MSAGQWLALRNPHYVAATTDLGVAIDKKINELSSRQWQGFKNYLKVSASRVSQPGRTRTR